MTLRITIEADKLLPDRLEQIRSVFRSCWENDLLDILDGALDRLQIRGEWIVKDGMSIWMGYDYASQDWITVRVTHLP